MIAFNDDVQYAFDQFTKLRYSAMQRRFSGFMTCSDLTDTFGALRGNRNHLETTAGGMCQRLIDRIYHPVWRRIMR